MLTHGRLGQLLESCRNLRRPEIQTVHVYIFSGLHSHRHDAFNLLDLRQEGYVLGFLLLQILSLVFMDARNLKFIRPEFSLSAGALCWESTSAAVRPATAAAVPAPATAAPIPKDKSPRTTLDVSPPVAASGIAAFIDVIRASCHWMSFSMLAFLDWMSAMVSSATVTASMASFLKRRAVSRTSVKVLNLEQSRGLAGKLAMRVCTALTQ